MASVAAQAVDTVALLYGRHDGFRALHAKGRVYAGRFTASPKAAELTRAAHMQGSPVEVTARLSNGSGDPEGHDGAPDGRGLAVKFYLPDGSRTDIVCVTLPLFTNRTPEDFVAFTRARVPREGSKRPRLTKLLPFLLRHPETLRAARAVGPWLRPVPSYANCQYNGLHAFRWIAGDGSDRHVRYSWIPEAGRENLSKSDAMARDPDYLQDEFAERLARWPVRFTLQLRIAREGDPVDDPTAPWPNDRETVEAGTLEITEPDTTREKGDDVLVFDPTRITDGIELTDDPIVTFRREAYNVSIKRRSGVGLEDTGPARATGPAGGHEGPPGLA